MANDITKIIVGKPKATGGLYTAAFGTALPSNETTALNAAFKGCGYCSDAGVVRTIGRDQQEIVAWGGDVVKKITTKHDVTYKFEMIETNEVSLGVIYGASRVTKTAATSTTGTKYAIQVTADELPTQPWIVELKDGIRTGRLVVPLAQVGEIGDTAYVSNNSIMYPITLTAYPDSSGVKAYEYWDDGVTT